MKLMKWKATEMQDQLRLMLIPCYRTAAIKRNGGRNKGSLCIQDKDLPPWQFLAGKKGTAVLLCYGGVCG